MTVSPTDTRARVVADAMPGQPTIDNKGKEGVHTDFCTLRTLWGPFLRR